MSIERPAFTIGIEEEYLLVDRETRDLVVRPPDLLWESLREVLGPQVVPEFIKAQIEVGTKVGANLAEARNDLASLRRELSAVVSGFGLAIVAASTHPFAEWWHQETTENERYSRLAHDMQVVARQLVICGMHVHVGIEDPHLRIDLMNQVRYFLPHLLALSTSSPFWSGHRTGLMGYRLAIFQTLPRTGIPQEFDSWGEYQRYVNILVNAGIIEDATKLWWDIRPSWRFPTLEMRISDVCTRLDDGMTIAAWYLALLRMLFRLRTENQRWRTYPPQLISENVWRAQRYGTDGELIDFGKGKLVPFADLINEGIELLSVDASEMGVLAEVMRARDIVRDGTSAHRQLAAYEAAIATGADAQEALRAVVDELIVDTLHGL